LYGWNDPVLNSYPWNGVGRLHYTGAFGVDDYMLINYTYFANDGFCRDPERYGQRNGAYPAVLSMPRGLYTGGANVSYTYPDLNNLFLGAVKADGTVLARSFHRDWTGFGPLDPANPNWYDTTNAALKYMVLRPRPVDHLLAGETWVAGVGPS